MAFKSLGRFKSIYPVLSPVLPLTLNVWNQVDIPSPVPNPAINSECLECLPLLQPLQALAAPSTFRHQ